VQNGRSALLGGGSIEFVEADINHNILVHARGRERERAGRALE